MSVKARWCLWIVGFWALVGMGAVAYAEEPGLLVQESKARAQIVKQVKKSVVHIRVEATAKAPEGLNNPYELFDEEFFERFFRGMPVPRPDGKQPPGRQFKQEGLGSGTIISADGYILTNNHVVGEADKIVVKLDDGREFPAKRIGTDPATDIAVIQIEAKDLPTLPIGNSDEMEVGESVIAIGNPFGLTQTVTFGIISAKGRSVGVADYEDFIQTDAAINPGNSGGPLINLQGQIIGVNTAIFTRTGGYQGIGFSVPINMARQIMEELIKTGSVSRGWLGVGIQDISPELMQAFGLKQLQGALITGVMPKTPAEKAGFQKGDVVLKFNGKPIKDSNHLRNEVAGTKSGAEVIAEVWRKGETKELKLTVSERPKKTENAESLKPEDSEALGLSVQELNPSLAQRFGYKQTEGVVIVGVQPNSPAAGAGLRAGLLIAEVDQQQITQLSEWQAALQKADLKKGVLLLIQSPEGARYVILKTE